ncbi:MAG: division/cell wall cluster transcriptional repressor MraZ [Bacillota bacterium]|nr:division/cell wall cluster transcriptional repressor MraZ [Bacillota bacterium]
MAKMIGEFHHTIDKKGRMSIPAKFREILGDNFVLMKGSDCCINGYSKEEWEKVEERVTDNDFFHKKENQGFIRNIFSSAQEVEVDSMGRILVPPGLREYADLEDRKEITVIGVVKRMEIWPTEVWEKYKAEMEDTIDIGAGMEKFEI